MIEVRVPATSANMGPGFDCLGVALNLYNSFYFEETEAGLHIEGCDEAYRNENNLVYTSMKKCFHLIGYKEKGLKIIFETSIPESRGLGSSASCILGGILAANEIGKGNLSKAEILELATEIEGHPDNIAPALFGGMTIAINEGKKVYYEKISLSKDLKFCALIPDFNLSTKEARAVLPDKVPYKDAVFNVGRASLLVAALANGNLEQLKAACEDKLHEIYRGGLIENYYEIIEESMRLNTLGVFLSGAGPTIMVMLKEDEVEFIKNMEVFLGSFNNKWIIKELKPDFNGAIVKNINMGRNE
jgi:homoserine kinase